MANFARLYKVKKNEPINIDPNKKAEFKFRAAGPDSDTSVIFE